jgi:hypothetical protein
MRQKVKRQFKGDTNPIFNLGHDITSDVDPENMVDIKNFKNFIMHQFVDFKYRIWRYHDWIFFNKLDV